MQSQSNFAEFMDHFTDNARSSLQRADGIARGLGAAYVGTEHILLGVLSQEGSVGARILESCGITLDRARLALNLTPRSLVVGIGTMGIKTLSETAKLTLRLSLDVAQDFAQDYCGTEHILYSILSQQNARATVLLRDMKVDMKGLMAQLEKYLNRQQNEYSSNPNPARPGQASKRQNILGNFGIDLTSKALAGKLP